MAGTGYVKFGNLYEELLTIEQSIERMERDYQNANCDTVTKCRLETAIARARSMYSNLMNSDFYFKDLNFYEVINAINKCISCVDIDV